VRLDVRRRLVSRLVRTEDCWTWRRPTRHPRMRVGGKEHVASHVMWWVVYGDWPAWSPRLRVVAQCGNYRCVRPRHLALASAEEIHRLRADRLELVYDRRCRTCERGFRANRYRVIRGWALYCSRGCMRAAM
jgi:hypothetical protein